MSKEQFVALVTTDQPLLPDCFGYDAVLNQRTGVAAAAA